jgi:superfamily II DNA or RNA helicase
VTLITLVVDNSTCQLQDLPFEVWKELRELLSYQIDSRTAYFSSARSNTRYLMDKKGGFPTGLLYLVLDYLATRGVSYRKEDRRKVPEPRTGLFKLTLGLTPYPEQLEAARAAKLASRGIICAPTGVGKSLIVALIIQELQVPTLIVVPSLELKRQLTASLREMFGDLTYIRVENVDALDPKAELKGYDCVIIDEFHHSGAKTYRDLNKKAWKGVYYKFGLTATPFRSKDEERLLLESVLSEVIYKVEHRVAVEKGYIVPIEAYYYELPLKEVTGNEMSWPSVYSELVVNRDDRNELIAKLLHSLFLARTSTLCLVKEIKHGNRLENMLNGAAAFANGESDLTPALIKQFNAGKEPVLIGTTGVLGEGVDTKPAEYIIIAGLGKSKNGFMQQCGRGFRRYEGKESCKVILFKDPSHKWTLQHFKAQVKYLREEYGITPVKLEIPI